MILVSVGKVPFIITTTKKLLWQEFSTLNFQTNHSGGAKFD